MPKLPTSFRLSERTRERLAALAAHFEASQVAVVQRAIDELWERTPAAHAATKEETRR